MIGSLGHNTHNTVVEVLLQGEVSLESLLDARDSVYVERGLLVPIISGVSCVGGAGQVPGENSFARGTCGLGGLGEGLLREIKCCSSCWTQGE